MKGINWKIRLKNKTFWLTLIPALLLLVQAAASFLGLELDVGALSERFTGLVNALFSVLAILGIVADPTTEGLTDSERAMGYSQPGRGD